MNASSAIDDSQVPEVASSRRSAWPAMSIAEAHARLTAPGSPFETEDAVIGGRRVRVWKQGPPSNRAVIEAARAHGDRIFLVHEGERVSFEAFYRAVAGLATELAARGIGKGDRVAIAMRNLPEWPVAFYAAAALGAIATPLNAWWTGPELIYGLVDSGARALVVDSERLARLDDSLARCPQMRHVILCRGADAAADNRTTRLEALIGTPGSWAALPDRPLPQVEVVPDDPATIFYTSGTTGEPKGALATNRNMLSNIVGAACAHARAALRRGEEMPVADPAAAQPGALIAIPFFHVTGCFAILSPALHAGMKLVMMRRWDAEAAMQIIERERLTSIIGVPTIAWQLVEHPARSRYDLSSLVSLGYGGAAAAPELVKRIAETLPAAVPGHGWGMTETSALATTHSGEDYASRPASCGAPIPVMDLKIMSADGTRELPCGEVGELWARGPNVVEGYWNKPSATAQTFVDGWLRTGDLARLDEEGFLYIVDRAKDMLIRGGENIYCIEVENRLYEHPAVMDAAVVGLAHKTLGEEPAAVVTLKPGTSATEAQLREHVAARLAAYKVPVRIIIERETLPRNANGKIMKNELKNLFAAPAAGAR